LYLQQFLWGAPRPGRLLHGVGPFLKFLLSLYGGHLPAKFCPGAMILFYVFDEFMLAKPVPQKKKKRKKQR